MIWTLILLTVPLFYRWDFLFLFVFFSFLNVYYHFIWKASLLKINKGTGRSLFQKFILIQHSSWWLRIKGIALFQECWRIQVEESCFTMVGNAILIWRIICRKTNLLRLLFFSSKIVLQMWLRSLFSQTNPISKICAMFCGPWSVSYILLKMWNYIS